MGKALAAKILSEFDSRYGNKKDSDDDDDDDDDDEDDDEEQAKSLAAKTLLAIRWLHSKNRLSHEEKRALTTDVIESAGKGNFSPVEVAFSLIIGNGRPSEGLNELIPLDMSLVDEDDMNEFENACKNIIRTYWYRVPGKN